MSMGNEKGDGINSKVGNNSPTVLSCWWDLPGVGLRSWVHKSHTEIQQLCAGK